MCQYNLFLSRKYRKLWRWTTKCWPGVFGIILWRLFPTLPQTRQPCDVGPLIPIREYGPRDVSCHAKREFWPKLPPSSHTTLYSLRMASLQGYVDRMYSSNLCATYALIRFWNDRPCSLDPSRWTCDRGWYALPWTVVVCSFFLSFEPWRVLWLDMTRNQMSSYPIPRSAFTVQTKVLKRFPWDYT